MIGWVAPEKRQFFFIVVAVLCVEVILIVLITRAEHERFAALDAEVLAELGVDRDLPPMMQAQAYEYRDKPDIQEKHGNDPPEFL